VREYFAKQVRGQCARAWRLAHRRLYDHLKDTTDDKDQPTLEDLQPLYQAVSNGCQAGLYEAARVDVYQRRIHQIHHGNEFYAVRRLGAFGAELGALAWFFEQPWIRVRPAVKSARGFLLNQVAMSLRALGRLTEATEPMLAAFEWAKERDDTSHAALAGANLGEIELTLGSIVGALSYAQQSVILADRSGDGFMRMSCRTVLADGLHQAGRREEALASFREAEAMQAKGQPKHPRLYST
jgi:tetratricopeptide (TPR) repeat protein